MKLPEKYKGATPGPYRWLNGALMADHGRRPAMLTSGGSRGCAIYTQGPNGVLCDISEVSAQAQLFEDAPMLACRVAELEELLNRVLPYAESRAEDLTEFKEAGQEDPEFPGADEAWAAVHEAYAALSAPPFGLAADQSQEARADESAAR